MSLDVRGLVRRFERTRAAVDDVSFVAPHGAITTLLGPSGSGKTTVLRIIAGLEVPDAGRVTVDDTDWTKVPVRRRNVGLVFQSYALFRHMTVRDNVAFGLRAKKLSRRDTADRVRELLELVQLGELAERYPAQLSGGQQQRVAFARALAPAPSLLLLDEPFGALDTNVRVELRRWLCELHDKTRVTTVLVTHDQDEALEISQKVVVMNAGRVEQAGTPSDVYDQPATPFVASFVGAATRLAGRVAGGRAQLGALIVDAAGASDGASVAAYVRPHDVRLRAVNGAGGGGVDLARVVRCIRIGGIVKVELRLGSGELLDVQLSSAEAAELGVRSGDSVLVDVRTARVFVGDYSI
ncbi:MAG: sulfate/molybdate ABC transporter ATP-binding protein [Polyangia bacterium]